MTVFAIGDIHGCAAHLRQMHEKIWRHAAQFPDNKNIIVYLGDYIDRGADSKGVIDELLAPPPSGFEKIYIKGNHEQMLLNYISGAAHAQSWLDYINGGRATIESYGAAAVGNFPDYNKTVSEFIAAIPPIHLQFYKNLKMFFEIGDYFFVHAGVHPNRHLHDQLDDDMLWIREPFLSSGKNMGKIVVHGHTITAHPDKHPHRIGIDTGAYWSGNLTALALRGKSQEFIQVSIKQ